MNRTCAYVNCSAPLPEDSTARRRYCKHGHRTAAADRRHRDELRRLRAAAAAT